MILVKQVPQKRVKNMTEIIPHMKKNSDIYLKHSQLHFSLTVTKVRFTEKVSIINMSLIIVLSV